MRLTIEAQLAQEQEILDRLRMQERECACKLREAEIARQMWTHESDPYDPMRIDLTYAVCHARLGVRAVREQIRAHEVSVARIRSRLAGEARTNKEETTHDHHDTTAQA